MIFNPALRLPAVQELVRHVDQFISQRRTPLRCAGNCFPRTRKNKKLSNIIRLYINKADVSPDQRPSPYARSNESPAGGQDPPKAESSWDTVHDKHNV